MRVFPRESSIVPRFSSSRSTLFTVGLAAPASSASASCVRVIAGIPSAPGTARPARRAGGVRGAPPARRGPRAAARSSIRTSLARKCDSTSVTPGARAADGRIGLVDRERLGLLEREHGRRAACAADERHLAEALAGPADRDRRGVAERRHDLDREAALADQVQRVTRVVAVEDDLVAREAAPARDLQQLAHLLGRHVLEQPPLHTPDPLSAR